MQAVSISTWIFKRIRDFSSSPVYTMVSKANRSDLIITTPPVDRIAGRLMPIAREGSRHR